MWTSASESDFINEYDLENTIPKDLLAIFNSLEINAVDMKVINLLEEEYKRQLEKLSSITTYVPLMSFYTSTFASSTTYSYEIEGENLKQEEVFEINSQLQKLILEHNFKHDFNVDFVKNIKLLNKIVNPHKNGGKLRSLTKSNNVIIKTSNGNLLPIKYENFTKFFKVIDNFNLAVTNEDNRFAKAWLLHCYFEMMHPFDDGNGRVGRFILNNYINQYSDHLIYIDKYIYEDIQGYYNALFEFQVNKNYEKSVNWFLGIIIKALQGESQKVSDLIITYHILLNKLESDEYLKTYADSICSYIYTGNVFTLRLFKIHLDLDVRTVKRIVTKLISVGIIKEISADRFVLN